MNNSLFQKEVVPFFLTFALLMVATVIADFLLHQFQLVWIGRYLGIPGTILILLSFLYTLRKRKIIQVGKPKFWINLHGLLTWVGTLMILVHAGIHFNAILPWLAIIAMLINVISGLTGKFLLNRAQRYLSSKKADLLQQGMSSNSIEKEIFWDAVTFDVMKKWRAVHFPITLVFSVLSLIHIISIFLFWEWK
jgi:hypothetical protein